MVLLGNFHMIGTIYGVFNIKGMGLVRQGTLNTISWCIPPIVGVYLEYCGFGDDGWSVVDG